MTTNLCIFVAIALFLMTAAASREIAGVSPLRMSWGFHAISVLLIMVAISTRGIWYHADLYLVDIWTAQDALRRVQEGFRSSLDYFNPIGPVMDWLFALTLLVQPPSSSSLVLANVAVAILSLILTIVLLRHRASPITVAIAGLIAVTTALSARDIDSLITDSQSSMLAPYNRWGWALLVPVALRAALPGTRTDVAGSALAGLLIAVLVLLKITYGLAAIGIFLVVVALYPSRWREIGVVGLSTVASVILLDWATGGQVRAYFGDIATSAQMAANGVRFPKLVSLLPPFIAFSVGCVLLAAAKQGGEGRPGAHLLASWRTLIVTLAVGGSGLVVLMQNHYNTEAVTLLLMPLIVAERDGMMTNVAGHKFGLWTRHAQWVTPVILLTLSLPTIDSGFILAQKVQTERKQYLAKPFAGTEFHDLVVDEIYHVAPGGQCIDKTCNDLRRMFTGRDLIRQHCPAYRTSAVLAFNFSNPFPALLGSPSPKHMPIWLHTDRSYSRDFHSPGPELFAEVGCVIVARNDLASVVLSEIYAKDLQRYFRPAAQNADWQLWARPVSQQGMR